MSLSPDVLRVLIAMADELDSAVAPVVRAAQHPASLQRLLHQAGWDVTGLLTADQQAVLTAVTAMEQAVASVMAGPVEASEIAALAGAGSDAAVALVEAAAEVQPLIESALAAQGPPLPAPVIADLASRLIADLGDLLLLRWLERTSPAALTLARMLGLVTTVRQPALYLNDPPHSPPLPPAGADDAPVPTPVRWAMHRPGLNRAGLSHPLVLNLVGYLEDMPRAAYRSPASFLAAVQAELNTRVDRLLAALASRPIGTIGASITANGVSITAANWLPTTLVDWNSTVEFPIEAPSGPLPLPLTARIERETWSVLWDPTTDRDELDVVPGVLTLIDRFETSAAPMPGATLALDATDPQAFAVAFALTLGFELQVATSVEPVELAVTTSASVDADGVEIVFDAAAYGIVEVPLMVPGLTGLAIGVAEPAMRLIADVDEDPRLDIHASVSGFTLRLPTEIARKAELGPDGWFLVDGESPVVALSLPAEAPLLSLGIAASSTGIAVDRFDFLAPASDGVNAWQLTFDADPIYVGGGDIASGIIIEINSTTYVAEADQPFGQISVPRAEVHLPPDLPAAPEAIVIENATIDENGFSGAVSIAFASHRDEQDLEPLFGVIPIAFQSIALVIEQNVPTAFELRAAIELPYFDDWVDVLIAVDDQFNLLFHVESVDPEGITLTKDELLALHFRSATFEWNRNERRLGLGLSGGIEPLLWNADGLEWPRLDVTNLQVDQVLPASIDEPIEPPILRFEEAWLDLKELATLDLFGFHFELNRIGIGYLEATDELWLDLTGSLRLIEQIPIGLGVEGFRITWPRRIYEELGIGVSEQGVEIDLTVDEMLQLASRIQVRFDGIYLFYGIPQAVEFEGYIRFIKTPDKVGFAGDVALRVPTSGLAIEAGLMAGMNLADPPYPFLYVYFGVLLPSGIPLGQSGLAFKGAKGLFGLNVEPDRDPEQNPYYDWYKRGPIEGAHPTNKWRDRIWSVALGAGITITTTDGKILGVQGLLALAIPGPIIFVEGKALVFDGVFPIDSPLKALGYFDGTQLTTQLNIEASLELIEGVVDVAAGIEAFFDFRNLLNWHLYLGQDEPEDRRVRANFLQLPAIGWLFGADAYLMIDMPAADSPTTSIDVDDLSVRARMGVHIGFEPPAIDLVVASAAVHAVLDGSGLVTVNPFLFTGSVDVDALLDIEAFGLVLVGVEARADMGVEGALPLDARAELAVRVDLPVPDFDEVPLVGDELASAFDWFEEHVVDLPDIPDHLEVEVPFHWRLDRPPVLDPLVAGVSLEGRFGQGGIEAALAGAAPIADAPVVPLDARPVIRFDQAINVEEGMEFGGFSSDRSERFDAGQLTFVPTLTSVRLYQLPADELVDGESEAWTQIGTTSPAEMSATADPLWGLFRPAVDASDGLRPSRRTLELWSANPFEHLTSSIPFTLPAQTLDGGAHVSPLEATGVATHPWCDAREASERCLGHDQIKEAAENGRLRPQAEHGAEGQRHRLEWGALGHGLVMIAPDIRFGVDGPRAHVALDARRRDRFATLEFPARVLAVRVVVASKEVAAVARRTVLTGRASNGITMQDIEADIQVDVSELTEISLSDPDGFDHVVLSSRSPLHVLEVCWTTVDEAGAAATRSATCAANELVTERATDPGSFLSPGAYYRIEVDTSVVMDEAASAPAAALLASLPGFSDGVSQYRIGQSGPHETTDFYYFRTDGPPADLRPYVKWMSPEHQTSGHVTDDDLVVRFNRPYVHRFFPDEDNGAPGAPGSPYALEALVRDADGTVHDGWFLNWTTAASATLVPEEQYWFDEIAPTSAPGVTPPPDDVLEIRRRLDIRTVGEVPASAWTAVRVDDVRALPTRADLPARSPVGPIRRPIRRPRPGRRAQWTHRGRNEIAARLHSDPNMHMNVITGSTWGAVSAAVEVDVASSSHATWSVGLVVLYEDHQNHHLVRMRVGDADRLARPDRRGPSAALEIVQVRDGATKVLESLDIGRLSDLTDRPIDLAVGVTPQATGHTITARAAGVRVEADAELAPATGSIGLMVKGTDASFNRLTITGGTNAGRGGLRPASRYTLMLVGGVGGPTRRHDHFHDQLDWWPSTVGWTHGNSGLTASGQGSTLAFGEAFDDGEVTSTLILNPGEAITVGLRTEDDRRGQPGDRDQHRYEVVISRDAQECRVDLHARRGATGPRADLAVGQTLVGPTTRLEVRIRLIGDQVRVWLFDREMINHTLQTASLPDGTTTGVVRRGSLEWRAEAGTPRVRSVHVREPAVLETSFTTANTASFSDRLSQVHVVTEPLTTTSSWDDLSASIAEAADRQRIVADRTASFHATQRRFALKRADREDVERSRQELVVARSNLDEALAATFTQLDAGPVLVPTDPSLRRVETTAGLVVGWVLRSPESLDPRRWASSDDAALTSVGRTSFTLVTPAGGLHTHWIASADGTTLLVYRASGGPISSASTSADLHPIAAGGGSQLQVFHVRDHEDDHSDLDHLLDRSYTLSRGSRTPIEFTIALP
ncbi:MAG: hypothetical protein AAF467_07330 [Actinomycetota bacterium]